MLAFFAKAALIEALLNISGVTLASVLEPHSIEPASKGKHRPNQAA